MLTTLASASTTTTSPLLLRLSGSSSSLSTSSLLSLSKSPFARSSLSKTQPQFFQHTPKPLSMYTSPMSWLGKLGFGGAKSTQTSMDSASSAIPQGPDDDIPAPGQHFAQFGAGCFWGVELAFQRVPGVTKTEVGYSQGYLDNPTYNNVCSGTTNHSEVVRVQYDPKECNYENLLDAFWARHDPTTLNRQVIC